MHRVEVVREERVPVVERVERTYEHVPAGERVERMGERVVERYPAYEGRYMTRSANHYSPARAEYVSRVAYRGPEEGKRLSSADHHFASRTFQGSTATMRQDRHSPLRRSAEK